MTGVQTCALPDFDVLDNDYAVILNRLRLKYVSEVEHGFDERTALILFGEEIWMELGKKYGVVLEFEKR